MHAIRRLSIVLFATVLAAPVSTGYAASHGVTHIDFDDAPARSFFGQTVALRNHYAPLGVLFRGSSPINGGGILNDSTFSGITGQSRPNFLVLNQTEEFRNGGSTAPPELISFAQPVSHVEMVVGAFFGAGGTAFLIAYDAQGKVVDRGSMSLDLAMKPISLEAKGITRVVVLSKAQDVLIDDLLAS